MNWRLTRRAALLGSLGGLAGCSWFDDLFSDNKVPLAGVREPVLAGFAGSGPLPTTDAPVALAAQVANADWAQPGENVRHDPGNVAGPASLTAAWSRGIGEGGGYRRKLTAQPIVAGGVVFTMDSDAVVNAFALGTGEHLWRVETQAEDSRSTNIGGGLTYDAGVLYAVTGRGDALALAPRDGTVKWRASLAQPARSQPTVANGALYVVELNDSLEAVDIKDGKHLWTYQAASATTSVFGQPAPAFADGLVIAGFGSGELSAIRADSGVMAWSDSLGASGGRGSLNDLASIRALPVVRDATVYAAGLGGLVVANDLHAGRRVWERDISSGHAPALSGDWLFILDSDQVLHAFTRADARVAWSLPLPHYNDPQAQKGPIYWVGPLLAGGRLYVANDADTPELAVVDATSGKLLSRMEIAGTASVSPVAASGTLLLVTDDGTLTAYR